MRKKNPFFFGSIFLSTERTELVGFFLQLGHFSLGDSAKLENETSGGGGLAGIDVPADNNGKMSFAFRHGAVGGRGKPRNAKGDVVRFQSFQMKWCGQ